MKALNHFLGLFFITILIGMTSCTKQDLEIEKSPLAPTKKVANASIDIASILIDQFAYSTSSDIFTALNFTIEDEIIMLTTNYQGGCTPVKFELVADPQISYNPWNVPVFKGRLILKNNNKCNYMIKETISFNLKPLQQNGHSQVILNIEGFGDVLYSY